MREDGFWYQITGFFRLIRDFRVPVFIGVALSLTGSLMSAIGPQFLSEITDEILGGILPSGNSIDLERITFLSCILVVLYSFGGLCTVAYRYIIPATGQRIAGFMRSLLMDKINSLPIGYLDRCRTGDLMSRVINDADTIGEESGNGINALATSVSILVVTVALMLWMSPALTAAAMIPSVSGFFIVRYTVSRTQKFFRQQSADLGRINALVEETYSGRRAVIAYGAEDQIAEQFEEYNGSLFRSARRARFFTGITPQLMGFMNNLSYVSVCLAGILLAMSSQITYGVIVAFIIYAKNLSRPMQQMSEAITSLQSVAASYERISLILGQPDAGDDSGKADLADVKGEVSFRDVTFGYPGSDPVIRGFSLDVSPGTRVAIVGPTGAGKTTLMNLLLRFYEPDSGDILIDGRSVRDITGASLHSAFSLVLQETWLFSGTVRENLVFNETGVSDREIEEACRKAGIHDFITGLPRGYDTVLDQSVMISAGQKQQITIARAIIRNAPMIIMDEATSSIDTRTEKVIQKGMDGLMEGRTSFIIAHRLSTVVNADLIVVLKDGRIAEQGSHSELLGRKGLYRELYSSGFGDFDERASPF